MPTGLIRRGARYALRRRVPKDLIASYGKVEIVRSLGTADPKVARRLLPVQWVALDEEFDERRGVIRPDPVLSVGTHRAAPVKLLERSTGTTWEELIVQWVNERRKGSKARQAHEAVVRWFNERVGEKPIAEVSKADVLTFKNKLLAEGTTPANVNVKLTRLRTLLNYAFDNDLISSKPASNVRVQDVDAAKNRRRPFDAEALNKLFGGPVHSLGSRPRSGKGEAAFWLPLLGLYTGARLEEMGQLRPQDVVRKAYPQPSGDVTESWFIQITSDEDENLRLKNAGSDRLVPVHPELERLGFLRYCLHAGKAGQTRLFPELKPDVHGRVTAKWGEWFSTYLRSTCGVADRRIVFHSLRHTFKDACRDSGIPEGIQRQLMGHSGKDVADSYGEGYSLHHLVTSITRYQVFGFTAKFAA